MTTLVSQPIGEHAHRSAAPADKTVQIEYPFVAITPDKATDDVNFSEIWRALWRRKWLIAGIVIIMTGAAGLIIRAIPSHYVADTLILVGNPIPESAQFDSTGGATGAPQPLRMDRESLDTEIEILKSPSLAAEVIRDLHLANLAELDPLLRQSTNTSYGETTKRMHDIFTALLGGTTPSERWRDPAAQLNETIANFASRLQVTQHSDSRMLSVTFNSTDPKLAAAVPNSLSAHYIANKEQDRVRADQGMSAWLQGRITDLQSKVDSSQRAIQKYQAENHLFFVPDKSPLAVKEMTEVAAQLEQAREQLTRIENGGSSAAGSDSGGSAELQDLRRQEVDVQRRFAALSADLGRENPRSLAVAAELRQIRSAIAVAGRAAGRRAAGSRAARIKAAQANVAALQDRLQNLQHQVTNVSSAQIKLDALERDAAANRLVLKNFLDRSAVLLQRSYSAHFADATVVSPAVPPTSPVKPRRGMLIIVAAICSLVVGCLLAHLLETRRRTFRTILEMESVTGHRALGLVPMTNASRLSPMTDARVAGSPYNLAIRLIYTRLVLAAGGKSNLVLVTSAVPHEGKTNLALALAAMAAQGNHRVALVDVDFWEARASEALGLRSGIGFAELLEGKAALSGVIVRDIGSGIDLIRPGRMSPGYDFTNETDWVGVLSTLNMHYEMVIIDAPPVLAVTETSILTAYADTVVLATRWNHTSRKTTQLALKRLREIGANIGGLVMTMVDEKKHAQLDGDEAIHFSKSIVDYYAQLPNQLTAEKGLVGPANANQRDSLPQRAAEVAVRLFEGPHKSGPIPVYDHAKWALIVIDANEELLSSSSVAHHAVDNINGIAASVHAYGALVVSIQRELNTVGRRLVSRIIATGYDGRHDHGDGVKPRFDLAASETFTTAGYDIFSAPGINEFLQRERIDHLCIVGSDQLGSIRSTIRTALYRGYRVTLISDGIVTAHAYPFERILKDLRSDRGTVLTRAQFTGRLTARDKTLASSTSIMMKAATLVTN